MIFFRLLWYEKHRYFAAKSDINAQHDDCVTGGVSFVQLVSNCNSTGHIVAFQMVIGSLVTGVPYLSFVCVLRVLNLV